MPNRAFLTVCLALLVAPRNAAGAVAARPVTVGDLMGLRSISDVRISPDGRQIAYVVSQPSLEKNEHDAVLYLVPVAGGAPARLTYGTRLFNKPRPAPHLRWSPDGTRLSFLAFAGDLPQVFALDVRGGEARALTASPQGVSDYCWSPDGGRLAYLAPDVPSPEEERRRKDKSWVIEVDRQDRPGRVWVQDLAGSALAAAGAAGAAGAAAAAGEAGAARALSPRDQFVAALDWSPDGATIVYAGSPRPGFVGQFHTRLYAVPAAGGKPRAIVDRDGMNTSPQYSPDGRWIAFISTAGRPGMVSNWGLYLAPAAGGDPLRIRSLAPDAWVAEFTWAPDSGSVLAVPNASEAQRGAHMFEQPLLRLWLDGRRAELAPGPFVHYSPSLSRDGRHLAFRSVAALDMGDVFVLDLDGSAGSGAPRRLTEVNPELKELALGRLEPVHWTSFDGMEIWGLLLTPPGDGGLRERGRLPLVVYVHGGPNGGVTYGVFPQFMHSVGQVEPYPIQAMASAGMAVLLPMPRGGAGYGEAGFRMIENAWGEGDYRDIMAGVDLLVKGGLADAERLGVMGASYGGYMTDWIVTQSHRFKAASAMCSISDLADLYYLSDGGDMMQQYFGLPWEAPEAYARHSPITYAARVTTPLLIQHGENDRRAPIMQATKFYKALKEQGKIVEMEIYPRGGHVIYEPALEQEIMRRNLAWFRKWLQPGPPTPSP